MSNEYSSSLHRASAEYRDFDLPPPDTKRWVTRRKAVIVNAVRTGVISLEEVCRRYELSVEEFVAWQRAIDANGVPGLRVTRLQIYRDNPSSRVVKPVAKRVNRCTREPLRALRPDAVLTPLRASKRSRSRAELEV